jgi:hypothetical protein
MLELFAAAVNSQLSVPLERAQGMFMNVMKCSYLCLCPTWNRAVAWGPREMGSAWGRGLEEGPALQKGGKVSSQCPTKDKDKDEVIKSVRGRTDDSLKRGSVWSLCFLLARILITTFCTVIRG